MPNCFHFKKYLQKIDGGDPAALLRNYLEFHAEDDQDFNTDILKNFFLWILQDPYYRSINHSVVHFIFDEVQPYFRQNYLDTEFLKLKSDLPFQVIPINRQEDALAALKNWYTKNSASHDTFHILPLKDFKMMILRLKVDGRLEVFIHSSIFCLDQGILRPLAPLTCLYYSAHFELDPLKVHRVYHPPNQFFNIHIRNSHLMDVLKMSFPESQEIERIPLTKLEDCEELFNHIKILENHYIQPKTDPTYTELIQSMQTCYHMLVTGQPDAVQKSKDILEKAQSALKFFYTNDRLLLLLFANIEYRLKRETEQMSNFFIKNSIKNEPLKSKPDHFIQSSTHSRTSE